MVLTTFSLILSDVNVFHVFTGCTLKMCLLDSMPF
jgi:hypothetical protein